MRSFVGFLQLSVRQDFNPLYDKIMHAKFLVSFKAIKIQTFFFFVGNVVVSFSFSVSLPVEGDAI